VLDYAAGLEQDKGNVKVYPKWQIFDMI
jgi:hypothetical protein